MTATITPISSHQFDLNLNKTSSAPPPSTEPESGGDDWWSDNCDSVVIPEQPETACYFNNDDALVIRQRTGFLSDDEDQAIMIRPENIGAFLVKLADICGLSLVRRKS